MLQPSQQGRSPNLTELEILALQDEVNVSDGHARQDLTQGQREIVDSLTDIFYEAADTPVLEVERRAQRAFFEAMGQSTAAVDQGRVLSCYASSVAMEIVARAMVGRIETVRLIHPTFDNIPDILKGVGLGLVPVEEDTLAQGNATDVLPRGTEALFLTTPNNPTGRIVDQERLTFIANECARRGVLLLLDTSFRGFDRRAQYDHYAILDASGTQYVVIEDTGKLWPTLDAKVGMLVHSAGLDLPIHKVYTDILLGVSPFLLALMERFALDAGNGGLDELHQQMDERRAIVRATLAGTRTVAFPDADSRVSVERLELSPPRTATEVWRELWSRRVHVLPCGPFHWDRPGEGDRFIRVALARPVTVVSSAAAAIRELMAAGAA
jgi:enduracididine biosynthesis enzyme MppP